MFFVQTAAELQRALGAHAAKSLNTKDHAALGPAWHIVALKLAELISEYPSGFTRAIALTEIEAAWRDLIDRADRPCKGGEPLQRLTAAAAENGMALGLHTPDDPAFETTVAGVRALPGSATLVVELADALGAPVALEMYVPARWQRLVDRAGAAALVGLGLRLVAPAVSPPGRSRPVRLLPTCLAVWVLSGPPGETPPGLAALLAGQVRGTVVGREFSADGGPATLRLDCGVAVVLTADQAPLAHLVHEREQLTVVELGGPPATGRREVRLGQGSVLFVRRAPTEGATAAVSPAAGQHARATVKRLSSQGAAVWALVTAVELEDGRRLRVALADETGAVALHVPVPPEGTAAEGTFVAWARARVGHVMLVPGARRCPDDPAALLPDAGRAPFNLSRLAGVLASPLGLAAAPTAPLPMPFVARGATVARIRRPAHSAAFVVRCHRTCWAPAPADAAVPAACSFCGVLRGQPAADTIPLLALDLQLDNVPGVPAFWASLALDPSAQRLFSAALGELLASPFVGDISAEHEALLARAIVGQRVTVLVSRYACNSGCSFRIDQCVSWCSAAGSGYSQ